MPTLRDVAVHAGVSVGSVSAVLNSSAPVSSDVRARVTRAVDELGYVPHAVARSLKLGRTGVIGLVLPDITNPHFSGLAHAIEGVCDELGLLLTLCLTSDVAERERRQLILLQRQRADGLLLVPGAQTEAADGRLRRVLSKPVVLIDRLVPGLDADAVVLDNRDAVRRLTGRLLARGHQRIGLLSGPLQMEVARERLEGYRSAMADAGRVVEADLIKVTDYQPGAAAAATASLLGGVRPTALVSTSNHITLGVLKALAAHGIGVPEAMSVVALDDFAWSDGFSPRLTVAAQPVERMGQTAARWLIERMSGLADGAPRRAVFPADIIERGSVAEPRKQEKRRGGRT